jgi:hypothetical protein
MLKLSRNVLIGLCALLMIAAMAGSTSASVALNFSPSTSTISVGSEFDVDVFAFGLDETDLAAYILDIGFNDDVLDFKDVTFGAELGYPLDSVTDVTPGIGQVNVAETSMLFDFSGQPDAFTLFTMTFTAEAFGDSALSFLGVELTDSDANLIDSGFGASINVVPVPAAVWLLASGLLGMVGLRKKVAW